MSPSARALAECRRLGYVAAVVERFNAHSFHKNDMHGFADLVVNGRGAGSGPLALQVTGSTSGGNHAARRAKILAEPRAELWLRDGGHIEVWSFSKRGAAGKRKLYELRREPIYLDHFPPDEVEQSYRGCVERVRRHLEAIRQEEADRRAAKKAARAS